MPNDLIKRFPEVFTHFEDKTDARYQGDPNGDYVMAEHVNSVQDAVMAIERYLGIQPNSDATLMERVRHLEAFSSFSVPTYHWYNTLPTNPSIIKNTLARWDNIIISSPSQAFLGILESLTQPIYMVLNAQVALSVFQTNAGLAKTRGFKGVLIGDFDKLTTRAAQQSLLNSLADQDLQIIIQTINPNQLFSTERFGDYNVGQVELNFPKGTQLLLEGFGYKGTFNSISYLNNTVYPIVQQAKSRGIKLIGMGEPTEQKPYNFFQTAALLFGLDGIYNGKMNGTTYNEEPPYYHWYAPLVNWRTDDLVILYEPGKLSRRVTNGEIVLEDTGVARVQGQSIDAGFIEWSNQTVPGSAIVNYSIDPIKISSYDIKRIIDQLNNSNNDIMIDITKVNMGEDGGLPGSIPAKNMQAHVIEAINKKVNQFSDETDQIIGEAIQSLDAEKLYGHIRRELFQEYSIPAINATDSLTNYINHVYGRFQNLNVPGTIDAGHLQAISVGAQTVNATDAISTRDLLTAGYHYGYQGEYERLYVEWLTAEKLDGLKYLHVENLTADNIGALVLTAVEAFIDEGHFQSIVTKSLEAETIQAQLITALNLIVDHQITNSALIGEGTILDAHILSLDAGKLNAGVINTAHVNLMSESGALLLQDDHLRIYDEIDSGGDRRLRVALGEVSDIASDFRVAITSLETEIERLNVEVAKQATDKLKEPFLSQIGQRESELDALLEEEQRALAENSVDKQYGLVVLGKDGTTRLFDNTGVYNAGLHNNVISDRNLQDSAVGERVIAAHSISAQKIQADAIIARHIAADTINAFHILSDEIVARHIHTDAIESRHISASTIDAVHLNANIIDSKHIRAGVIDASRLKVGDFANLMQDGYDSFEQEPEGTFLGITIAGAPQATITKRTNNSVQGEAWSYDGIKALKLSGNTPTNRIALMKSDIDYTIMLNAGQEYIVSAYINTYATSQVPVTIGMTFNKDHPDVISESMYITKDFGNDRIFLRFTVPNDVLRGAVVLGVESTNVEVFFDGIQVERRQINTDFPELSQTKPTEWKTTSLTRIDGDSIQTGYIDARHIHIGNGTVFGNRDADASIIDITDEGIKAYAGDRSTNSIRYAMLNSKGLEIVGGAFTLEGGTLQNSIRIDGTEGIKVENLNSLITLNTTEGFRIVNKLSEQVLFDIDSQTGDLRLSGSAKFYASDSTEMSLDSLLDKVGETEIAIGDTNSGLIKDIADAHYSITEVEGIANSKMRVFSAQPVPPYTVNDLWTQGASGELYRAINSRAKGVPFHPDDWVKATKYTDDSAVGKLHDSVNDFILENDRQQSVRLGMKVNYSDFNTPAVNQFFFTKRQTNLDDYGNTLVNEDGSLYNFTTNTVITVPRQSLNLNKIEASLIARGIPHDIKGYIIVDSTTQLIWFVYYYKEYTEHINPITEIVERIPSNQYWIRWNHGKPGSNTSITLGDNTYVIGELEISNT